jgi:hypothetical protein
MKNIFNTALGIAALMLVFSSCKKSDYSMGELTTPSDLVLTSTVVGADATHPNGDSSGLVTVNLIGKNGISYRVDWDAADAESYDVLPAGNTITHRYLDTGQHTYTVTGKAIGAGGQVFATTTKTVSVYTKFAPDPVLVTNLTNDDTKTWNVDKSVPGHMGVGPWDGSSGPDWWAAGVNEKVACCNCFYTASYKFTKTATGYTLQVTTPDGAFTKTGALTTLPGIPAAGDEACYNYSGGTSSFGLAPASSGIGADKSTQTAIILAGNSTFIGYGAVLKEYEILSITESALYLRVRGTEPVNAWYIKLKAQ